MRPLDELIADLSVRPIRISLNRRALERAVDSGSETLFHTPLIALAVLVIAKARRDMFRSQDVAVWVLSTLARRVEALGHSKRRLAWSVAIRARCADALLFLESAGLVDVSENAERGIAVTQQGRDLVNRLLRSEDEAGALARGILRAYRSVELGGLLLL